VSRTRASTNAQCEDVRLKSRGRGEFTYWSETVIGEGGGLGGGLDYRKKGRQHRSQGAKHSGDLQKGMYVRNHKETQGEWECWAGNTVERKKMGKGTYRSLAVLYQRNTYGGIQGESAGVHLDLQTILTESKLVKKPRANGSRRTQTSVKKYIQVQKKPI